MQSYSFVSIVYFKILEHKNRTLLAKMYFFHKKHRREFNHQDVPKRNGNNHSTVNYIFFLIYV